MEEKDQPPPPPPIVNQVQTFEPAPQVHQNGLPNILDALKQRQSLKKVDRNQIPKKEKTSTPVNRFMQQVVARRNEIVSGSKTVQKVITPKQLVNEEEFISKWTKNLLAKQICAVCIDVNNQQYRIELKGLILSKDVSKLERLMKLMENECVGYKIIDRTKAYPKINNMLPEILEYPGFQNLPFIKDTEPHKEYGWGFFCKDMLEVLFEMKLKKKDIHDRAVTLLKSVLQSISSPMLKQILTNKNEENFLQKAIQCDKTILAELIIDHLASRFTKQEIEVILKHSGPRYQSALRLAVTRSQPNVVSKLIQYIPASDRSNILDEAIAVINTAQTVSFEMVSVVEILCNDYYVRNINAVFKRQFGSEDLLCKIVTHYMEKRNEEKLETFVFRQAMKFKLFKVVNLFLEKYLNYVDLKDVLLLPEIANCGRPNLISKLVDKGFDLTLQDYNNETILHHIARTGDVELAKLVLSKCQELVNLKNCNGKTALDIAKSNARAQLVTVLKNDYNAQETSNALAFLCKDVMEYILTFLIDNSKSTQHIKLVNKEWYAAADSNIMWQYFCLHKYEYSGKLMRKSFKHVAYGLQCKEKLIKHFENQRHNHLYPRLFVQVKMDGNTEWRNIKNATEMIKRFATHEQSNEPVKKKSTTGGIGFDQIIADLKTRKKHVFKKSTLVDRKIQWLEISVQEYLKNLKMSALDSSIIPIITGCFSLANDLDKSPNEILMRKNYVIRFFKGFEHPDQALHLAVCDDLMICITETVETKKKEFNFRDIIKLNSV